jgi:hypothetical protein
VGHQYDEKPLLLDDELDPDSKPEQTHGDPFVKHQYKLKSLSYERNSSSDELEKLEIHRGLKNGLWKQEDVFALAPFPRANGSRKSSCAIKLEDKYRSSSEASSPSLGRNKPAACPGPVTSSPVVSSTFVDIDDKCYCEPGLQQPQAYLFAVSATPENVATPPRKISFQVEECKEKDLFGSSPFDSSGFNDLFDDRPNYATPEVHVTLNEQPQCFEASTSYFPEITATLASGSKFTCVNTIPTRAEESKDLFGSIPFDEITSLAPSCVGQQQRPTSLPLTQSPTFVDKALGTILSSSSQSAHLTQLPPMYKSYATQPLEMSVSPNMDLLSTTPMSPEPLVVQNSSKHKRHHLHHHHEKASKYQDKSKYRLINENLSDGINVLQSTKISLSSHKIGKSSTKKTPKSSKKSSAAATVGFSNMSFEDFPSDENNEDGIKYAIGGRAAYEVIREPEKRFSSLKRRSNPFI